MVEHPFNYEITTVVAVMGAVALHHRYGEVAETTRPEKAFAL